MTRRSASGYHWPIYKEESNDENQNLARGRRRRAALAVRGGADATRSHADPDRCGTGAKPTNVAERFSDTFAYKPDLALTFTFSCY